MSERAGVLHARQSVFSKLVAIKLGIATVPLVLVLAFGLLYVGPMMNTSTDAAVHVSSMPSPRPRPITKRQRTIGDRLDVQVRYERTGRRLGDSRQPADHHGGASFILTFPNIGLEKSA